MTAELDGGITFDAAAEATTMVTSDPTDIRRLAAHTSNVGVVASG